MLLKNYEDLFAFTEISSVEARIAMPEFFEDDDYANTEPVCRMFRNVRGSPRNRKGTMYAKNFEGYSIVVWVREHAIASLDYWAADYLVLRSTDIVGYSTVIAKDREEALNEAQYMGWLAILDKLKYITEALEEIL